MEESDEVRQTLLVQQSHEILCPDCETCITHDVILRKRKRRPIKPSESQVAVAEEEDDSDDMLVPQVILEQETHELICPVCEYFVTDGLILQKRKRSSEPLQGVERVTESGDDVDINDPWESPWRWFTQDSFNGDAAKEEESRVRNILDEQKTYDLLCPDCDACITDEVILQSRKRKIDAPGSAERKKPWQTGEAVTQQDRNRLQSRQLSEPESTGQTEIEELQDFEQEDPPLKRHRRSIYTADPAGYELRHDLQEQRSHDLSCPSCNSLITYEVILQKKTNRLEEPVPQDKKGRRSPTLDGRIDENPWKTRYKILFKRIRHGTASGAEERAAKYGAAANRSLTEPLLPVRQPVGEVTTPPMTTGERYQVLKAHAVAMTGPCGILYFVVFLFLWCVWLLLHML